MIHKIVSSGLSLLLLFVCGSLPVSAAQAPLQEEALFKELEQLENESFPYDVFRQRVAVLAALRDSYSQPVQGRIARLECWARDSEGGSEYQAAVAFATKQVEWARQRHDRLTEAGLLTCRGSYREKLGDMAQAKGDYDAALVLAEEINEPNLKFEALSYRGEMLVYQGALAEGLVDLLAAYDGYDALGLEGLKLQQLSLIANAYRRIGVYERAHEYIDELMKAYRRRHEEVELINAGLQLGLLYNDEGHYDKALPMFEAGERYYRQQQREMDLAWVWVQSSWSLLNLKRVDEALVKLELARPILLKHSAVSDQQALGLWQLVMGLTLEARQERGRALRHLTEAESIFRHEQNRYFLAQIYQARARLLEQQGKVNEALAAIKQYVRTKSELDRLLNAQRSTQIRLEFDMARKDLENQTLRANQRLQEEKLKQLQERRYWQYLVVSLLLLVMGLLVVHQRSRTRKMQRLAMTDELTGIHNRRQIQAKGQVLFRQAREQGKALSVLLLDIDHFKLVNDRLGHHVGDLVLIAVAVCIEGQLRRLDRVGRHGGEEFLVLLPDTHLDKATEVAERIRQEVAHLRIKEVPQDHPISISIGCAQQGPQDETLGDLVQRADEAMYRAKQAGRNQVMRAE
ncbi:TPA: GGDEF domain-containing protein [Aeromonas dhakensis]|nr:GGDEF domain-containing protein [Aeromonas dhakensis]